MTAGDLLERHWVSGRGQAPGQKREEQPSDASRLESPTRHGTPARGVEPWHAGVEPRRAAWSPSGRAWSPGTRRGAPAHGVEPWQAGVEPRHAAQS